MSKWELQQLRNYKHMYRYLILTLILAAIWSCEQPKSSDKSAGASVEGSSKAASKSSSQDREATTEASISENTPISETLGKTKEAVQTIKNEVGEATEKITVATDKKTSKSQPAEETKSVVTKAKDKVVETSKPTTKVEDMVKSEVTEPVVETTKPEVLKDVVTTTTSRPDATTQETPDVSKPTTTEEPPVQSRPTDTNPETKPEKPRQAQSKPMHSYFNYVLSKYVTDQGKVDYQGIKTEIGNLDKYVVDLQRFPPQADWSKNETLAYWINAYNAFTIKMICDNYPLASIKDLHSGKPWDHKWIKIDGETLSLNDIENVIIRPTFKEPRIHFAVNCAAKSCPPLANEAFTKTNLDVLLEKRTKSFINNTAYNDLTKNPAMVSKIFNWYKEDFGDVVTFVNKYIYDGVKPITAIDYTEYDWTLNN